MQNIGVGILGIGVFLPNEIRTNDWWPEEIVEKWQKSIPEFLPRLDAALQTEGQQRVFAAIQALSEDPFYGAIERRVLADDKYASEMEVEAAREAMARADIFASQIDVVLSYSAVPDYILSPNAAAIHHALGLRRDCMATSLDVVCNSFQQQMVFAESLIRSGRARYALLIQSNLSRRLVRPDSPASAWHGDGATAVVVGPMEEGFGFLSNVQRTNGAFHDAVVVSVRGKRWFEDGTNWAHVMDDRGRLIILDVADMAADAIGEALRIAGLAPPDVSFYASHQATAWFAEVTREHAGLVAAQTLTTFPLTASLNAANVPFVLATASREGILKRGDVVATYAGGNGLTWSSAVMRWWGG